MTLGILDRRPLHEVEATWKTDARPGRLFGQIVAEACLCGGVIRVRNTDDAIAGAVRVHNQSPAHEQWAIAAGWR